MLAEEDKKLAVASEETNKMLEGLQISSAEAQREGDKVAKDKAACEADAERIGKEKALAEIDLAKAQPFVDKANKAIASPWLGVLTCCGAFTLLMRLVSCCGSFLCRV